MAAHPWLRHENQPVPLDILVYRLVKSYLRATPFKRAALKVQLSSPWLMYMINIIKSEGFYYIFYITIIYTTCFSFISWYAFLYICCVVSEIFLVIMSHCIVLSNM